MSPTYDQYGWVFQQFDVSGENRGIRYVYNDRGYLERLREAKYGTTGDEYQVITTMDQRGNISEMALENGVSITAVYKDDSGFLEILSADGPGPLNQNIQSIIYTWDLLGNLIHRDEITSSGDSFVEEFLYDELNRLEDVLLEINNGGQNNILALTYKPNGNIASKTGVGTYQYNGVEGGPHAVTSAGGTTYTYDANGNQIEAWDGAVKVRDIKYTAFNKVRRIEKQVGVTTHYTEFTYGIGNSRTKRVDNNVVDGTNKTTWYFSGVERIHDGSRVKFRRYLGGVAIADHNITNGTESITCLVKDHLGGIHSITDDAGNIVEQMSYTAFGQRRMAGSSQLLDPLDLPGINQWTTRGFTGHEQVDAFGVIHMNGRIYDTKLGRMLQADPFIQAPKNSQSLNRYTYVFNNPLSYSDPSGYFSVGSVFKKVRSISSSLLNVVHPGIVSIHKALFEFTMTNKYANAVAGVVAAGFTPFCGGCGAALHAAVTTKYHGGDVGDAVISGGKAWALAAANGQGATSISDISYSQLLTDVTVAAVSVSNSNAAAGLSWAVNGAGNWNGFGDFAKSVYGGASKYYFNKGFTSIAHNLGLSLDEFNALLYVNSYLGRAVAGSSIGPNEEAITIFGWRGRDTEENLGLIWDVNDTILGFQGLLDAVSYDFIDNYRGQPIHTGHSLGSIRSNNLVNRGFSPSANIYSLPFGNVGAPGVKVTNNNFDPVNFFYFHRIFTPWADSITSCNSPALICHGLYQEYVK